MSLFRRILVPHDFSADATAALKVAGGLARQHGGRIHVLYVNAPVYPPPVLSGEMAGVWIPPSSMETQQRDSLTKIVARALGSDPPPYKCTVTQGHPTEEILDAASKADTIVMGTAGRTGLSHLVIGSVAERVVRHAPVPVLTVPPAKNRKRRRSTKPPTKPPAKRRARRGT